MTLDLDDYTVHGQALETVTSARTLGVTLQSDLGWEKLIDNIYGKANRMLGFYCFSFVLEEQV